MTIPAGADPHPVIPVWPSCGKCGAAFMLARRLSMSKGWLWLWGQECKCKTNIEPVIHDEREEEG